MNSHKKTTLLILSSFLLTAFSFTNQAKDEQFPQSLPLECSKIPNIIEQLCFIQTRNGPYDDVVFYHMDKYGDVALLGSRSGEVTTFGGIDFSTGGTYMWLSWAEEGHPILYFTAHANLSVMDPTPHH